MAQKKSPTPAMDEAVAHGARIRAIEVELAKIEETLDQFDTQLVTLGQPPALSIELETRVEDLSARQALGEDVADELLAAEEALEAAQDAHRASQADTAAQRRRINASVPGLERRMNALQAELGALRAANGEKVIAAIREKARDRGTKYLSNVERVVNDIHALVALHRVLGLFRDGETGPRIMNSAHFTATLPAFHAGPDMDAARRSAAEARNVVVATSDFNDKAARPHYAAMVAELEAAGLVLRGDA